MQPIFKPVELVFIGVSLKFFLKKRMKPFIRALFHGQRTNKATVTQSREGGNFGMHTAEPNNPKEGKNKFLVRMVN